MSPDDPRHGTVAGFDAETRAGSGTCPACRHAKMRYEKARLLGITGNKVPALGAQRRIAALRVLGWNLAQIAQAAGYSHASSLKYAMTHATITRSTHRRVADAYDQLADHAPPVASARRARTWARSVGCLHPPSAWLGVDIDDPEAEPDPGWSPTRKRGHATTTIVEDAEWMADNNETLTIAVERLGVTRDALHTACRRTGRLDVYHRLARRDPAIGEMSIAVRAALDRRGAA